MSTTLDKIDILGLEQDYTVEQKSVRDEVRRFIRQEYLPLVKECQSKGIFPKQIIAPLAKLGLLEPLATGNLDPILYGLALKEIERGSSALRSFLSVQGSLVMSAISFYGSAEHKEKWLGPLSRLDKIGCFALTEPDFGSNPSGMRTKAERTSEGYRIDGAKAWITNGTQADVVVLWAKLEDKVRGFLLEKERDKFEARSIEDKWSFRASDTAELFFDATVVPHSALLPESRSVGSALKCLNEARYGIVWGVIGAAEACLDETLQYLMNRPQFNGRPLASHQLIQNKMAWMCTEISGMQLIARRLGELKQGGKLRSEQVSLGKLNNCRKALEIARHCRELLGAAGIHHEHHVGRHMMDLETVVTYEGTENIHSLILGQHLTDIPAYSH